MSAAHLHLITNHFPLIGLFFATVLMSWGLLGRVPDFFRAGLVVSVIAGVFAVPTYLSGEPAEKELDHQPGFSQRVEEHEEAAEFGIWCIALTALASAAGFVQLSRKRRLEQRWMVALTLLALFSLTVIGRTSYLGGQISHPEIRDVADTPPAK